ncbi:MAG: DNA adenine methylase [Elusimicrobiota bacterium]|nr:DNA adenine methylase [Endomicrobiia bacterium]MDW8165091.1 DNA adenine methylase [Elusimicrobiota bacterium]
MLLNENFIKPKPFVKWAGGKSQLLKFIRERIPNSYNTYIEPFVGGGALFFELLPKKAIINDINEELINAYLVIKNNVDELINSLKKHEYKKEYYYYIRSLKPHELNNIERASRFIYLNRTCYNGLYKVNSKGEFNVSFGRYKNPKIVDEENLKAISHYLNYADITITCLDYKEVCSMANSGDFVYFDPPYYGVSFTKYTKYDFKEKDHIELAQIFTELDRRGCKVLLSNSNTEFTKNLYKGYKIEEVYATRGISCKVSTRKGGMLEIIVRNY